MNQIRHKEEEKRIKQTSTYRHIQKHIYKFIGWKIRSAGNWLKLS